MVHLLFYSETKPWIDDPSLSAGSCPKCKKRGHWRRGGPEFESEMRCGNCSVVWTPGLIEADRELHADFLKGQFGDGI